MSLPVPITLDLESGIWTDPHDLAAAMFETGAAGVNIEDGRGDHLDDSTDHADVIASYKAAAPNRFVNARIDTYWLGIGRDTTLERARRYADAGADGIFVPGCTDEHEIARIVESLGSIPLNVLSGPDPATLAALGVRRISTGSTPYRTALASAAAAADRQLRRIRTAPNPMSYDAVNNLAEIW